MVVAMTGNNDGDNDDDMGVTGTAEWMAPEVMEGAPYNQVAVELRPRLSSPAF